MFIAVLFVDSQAWACSDNTSSLWSGGSAPQGAGHHVRQVACLAQGHPIWAQPPVLTPTGFIAWSPLSPPQIAPAATQQAHHTSELHGVLAYINPNLSQTFPHLPEPLQSLDWEPSAHQGPFFHSPHLMSGILLILPSKCLQNPLSQSWPHLPAVPAASRACDPCHRVTCTRAQVPNPGSSRPSTLLFSVQAHLGWSFLGPPCHTFNLALLTPSSSLGLSHHRLLLLSKALTLSIGHLLPSCWWGCSEEDLCPLHPCRLSGPKWWLVHGQYVLWVSEPHGLKPSSVQWPGAAMLCSQPRPGDS